MKKRLKTEKIFSYLNLGIIANTFVIDSSQKLLYCQRIISKNVFQKRRISKYFNSLFWIDPNNYWNPFYALF